MLPEGVVCDRVIPCYVLEVGPGDVSSVGVVESTAATIDEERALSAAVKAVVFEEPGFGSLKLKISATKKKKQNHVSRKRLYLGNKKGAHGQWWQNLSLGMG